MEKKIPSYHTLVKDALACLLSIGGTATNKEILEAVMQKLDVNGILREKLNYNLGWAKVYAKKYGLIRARYKNAICLIWDEWLRAESMEEDLWGNPFLFTDIPHKKRVCGFPLDSISLEMETCRYFYDMEDDAQDELVSEDGYVRFFHNFMEKYQIF